MKCVAIDLFCGVGGLTHGVQKAGINVVAGIDIDSTCKYAYESNNNALFINKGVEDISETELESLYPEGCIKILMGCAPCQPFSTYSLRYHKNGKKDGKWKLLYYFANMIEKIKPDIVSMENVPQLTKEKVFTDFYNKLRKNNYYVHWSVVNSSNYGVPQNRKRLVLLASKFAEINMIPFTHLEENFITVRQAISCLPPINDGEAFEDDTLHKSSKLSDLNKKRILQSRPGGTWKDWDKELLCKCHKKATGKGYISVYGRMEWDKPSPTITTQFYGYGNGRFGHPEQNRAISFREGALLQSFPPDYKFIDKGSLLNFPT